VKQNLKQSKGCAFETPLAEVFFFPGNGARKLVDGAVMMMWKLLLQSRQRRQKASVAKLTWEYVVNDRPVGNPKRRFDEYSSKFSLSYETMVINPVGKSQYD
jgi:hypothetical protein